MRALIADDDRVSRRLLEGMLRGWGYEVVTADDGGAAWDVLTGDDPPTIALLDWCMPGLTGVEICSRLKARGDAHYVYKILVTQHDEDGAVGTALDAGADDFVAKPVEPVELRSRLGVAERIVGYWQALEQRNRQLSAYAREMEDLAESRARQLVHADRMATIGLLSAGVAHEINNPATFIAGNVQTLQRFWQDVDGWLDGSEVPTGDRAKLDFIREETPKALDGILDGVGRISVIVKGLKSYARREASPAGQVDVNQCIRNALALCQHHFRRADVTVETNLADTLPPIAGNRQHLEQLFVNLFVNATHAMEETAGAKLVVGSSSDGRKIVLTIDDNGTGIPADVLERIWDPFFTTKESGKGTGLGLAICRDIATEHGGRLSAGNRATGGASFVLELAIRPPQPLFEKGVADEAAAACG